MSERKVYAVEVMQVRTKIVYVRATSHEDAADRAMGKGKGLPTPAKDSGWHWHKKGVRSVQEVILPDPSPNKLKERFDLLRSDPT